uniref:hypothetical protein n=1 Tax=Flavobacterium sp. TaxID=239 RepID=UPI0025C6226E
MKNFTPKSFNFLKPVFLLFLLGISYQLQAQTCAGLNSIYQTRGGTGTTVNLFEYNLPLQRFNSVGISVTTGITSGAASAYNSNTGYLYINGDGTDPLHDVRVFDPANGFAYVGKISLNLMGTQDIYANMFSKGDYIYFRDEANNILTRFNVNHPFVGGVFSVNVEQIPLTNNMGGAYSANDYTYYNGKFYGIAGKGTSPRTECFLIIIDEVAQTLESRVLKLTDSNVSHRFGNTIGNDFGAVWIDSKGVMMFFNNDTGNVYLLKDVDLPGSTNISWVLPSNTSSDNDGFGCESIDLFTPIIAIGGTCSLPGTATITNYLNNASEYEYRFYEYPGGTPVSGVTISSTGVISGLNYNQAYTAALYIIGADYTSSPSEVFTIPSITGPTADAGSDFTKNCTINVAGKQIGMVAEPGVTYSWSPTTGLDFNSPYSSSNPFANPSVTTTYELTTTKSGCSKTDTVIVTVDTTPPATPIVTVVNNCGSSVLSTTAPGTLLWSNGQTGSSITVTDSATYTVTTTAANGCVSAAGSGVSAPNANPAAPTASVTVQPDCLTPTGTIVVTAPTPAANVTYTVTGTAPVRPAVTQSTTTFANLAPGTYAVTTTNTTTGCVSLPTNLTINAVPGNPAAPTANVTVQPDCLTPTGTIVVTAPAPAANVTYTVTGTSPVRPAVTQSTTTFANLAPGTYAVTTTNTTTGCVSLPTNLTINAVPGNPAAPTASVTVQPDCLIPTGTIVVTAPAPAANVTYTVTGTAPVRPAVTQSTTTFANLAPGTYAVTTTNTTTGCVSLPTNLTINAVPGNPAAPTASVTVQPDCL